MKKYFSFSAYLVAAFISVNVNAQTNSSLPLTYEEKTEAPLKAINTRAIKSFNRNYKHATNVRWFNDSETILAYFTEGGKQTRVIYYPNGKWLHTLISYDESLLNHRIKSIVRDNFRGFKITNITEVHEADMVCYFVNIEKEKEFKQVIVYNEETAVYKEFTLSK